MGAADNLRPEQFGISAHESAKIQGDALGAHLWAGMEKIFGNMKVQGQSDSYDHLRQRFPTHDIKMDERGDPFVEAKKGNWSLRHFDAPNAEIHHARHGPQDLIDWGEHDYPHVNEDHMKQELDHWVKHTAPDYEASFRAHRNLR